MSTAVEIRRVTHDYGSRRALDAVEFTVDRGEIFALLGPNGGGKTTLFRLLSTLIPLHGGEIRVLGFDVARQTLDVRRRIGVVFQAPALDRKLTVAENLRHQGHLYGLAGTDLRRREDELLGVLSLADRRDDLVETLSGGLRRRVELAKGMLHHPQVLILDEPSTGLDPGARRDLWDYLRRVRAEQGVTVVLTTHLLEEADKADRLAILDAGRVVALDTPEKLRSEIGGDTIVIACDDSAAMLRGLRERLDLDASIIDGQVRLEHADAHRLVPQIVEAFPGAVRSVTLGKPTLEDVFIARTGRRFADVEPASAPQRRSAAAGGRR